MTKHEIRVRVLLYQDNNKWIAQCLEYDFATQGNTTKIALDAFGKLFIGQIELDIADGLEPLSEIDSAPEWWIQTFENAHRLQPKESREFKVLKDSFEHLVEPSLQDIRIYA